MCEAEVFPHTQASSGSRSADVQPRTHRLTHHARSFSFALNLVGKGHSPGASPRRKVAPFGAVCHRTPLVSFTMHEFCEWSVVVYLFGSTLTTIKNRTQI